MLDRNGKFDASRDFEAILGLSGIHLSIEGTAELVAGIVNKDKDIDLTLALHIDATSLSFRTTGISPSQTAKEDETSLSLVQRATQITVGVAFCSFMIGVQILGYLLQGSGGDRASLQALIMGTCGFIGVVTFTFCLLILVKAEVLVEPQRLPDVFDEAVWTFSDARHAEHQAIIMPPKVVLAIASPAEFTMKQRRNRFTITSLLCAGLMVSYVVYYLGLHVAQWWVALSHVGLIWFAAGYRSLIIQNMLVATDQELGEHWLGIFRDNLYDSVLETTETLAKRKLPEAATTSKTAAAAGRNNGPNMSPIEMSPPSYCLLSARPIRQSLRNWSGCEDVMKVAFELAKRICHNNRCKLSYVPLTPPTFTSVPNGKFTSWKGLFRFQLVTYVPGLLWTSRGQIDYVLTEHEFDMPNIYRDVLKLFHLCADELGDVSTHVVSDVEKLQLSEALCGPVTPPDRDNVPAEMTLSQLLLFLRDGQHTGISSAPKAYVLEQAILLPSLQLALMYEDTSTSAASTIGVYQNSHTDKLVLSGGGQWLGCLDAILQREGVWDMMMEAKVTSGIPAQPSGRDANSGLYGEGFGNNRESQWLRRASQGYEEHP